MMKIRYMEEKDFNQVSSLVGGFRVDLAALKGIVREVNLESAKEELGDYVNNQFPILVVEDKNSLIGYAVCKVNDGVVWLESLYTLPECRRKGAASMLFDKAQELSLEQGSETLYVWVHPNNDRMINFLNKKGYNVLNLIEIRRQRSNEEIKTKVHVEKHEFDY